MITDRACRLLLVLSPLVFAACQESGIADRVETILQRLEREGNCNAVLAIAPDAVQQARALDSDPQRGPLNGVPVLVKDNIHVAGMPTTAGSLALLENIAEADAPIIANLKRAGAVIVGKTSGGKTEILKGVKAGDEVLLEKPAK